MLLSKYFFRGEFTEYEAALRAAGARPAELDRGVYFTDLINPDSDIYFIAEGVIRFTLVGGSGRENHLMYFGPGEIFPFVLPHISSAISTNLIAEVVEPVKGLSFSPLLVEKLIRSQPDFAVRASQHLLSEVRLLLTRELLNHSTSPEFRVCTFLYLFDQSSPSPEHVMYFTHSEVAAAVGLSRVQVSRVISRLRADGILETGRGRIKIKNMEKLKCCCSENSR